MNKRNIFRLAVLATTASAAFLLAGCGTAPLPDAWVMGIDPRLAAEGRSLRTALDERYRESIGRREPGVAVDASDVVLRYLPSGSDFEQAISVLRAAGFDVRPPAPYLGDRQRLVRPAYLHGIRRSLVGETSVGLFLFPASNDDWSRVGGIRAEIYQDLFVL